MTQTISPVPKRLTPKIGLPGLVFFGVSYMSIVVGIQVFGILAETSNNTTASTFLLATLAMLLTALSYAVLARQYPMSGSVYTYARELLGGKLGFLSGWMLLLDYLFLPMVANFLLAIYLNAQFPVMPLWGWLLLIAVVLSAVNIIGLKATDAVNKTFVIAVAIVFLIVIGFFVSALANQPPTDLAAPFWNSTTTLPAVTAAAAIAAYSFLGFDAVSTLSEEARDARRTIPRAIVLTVVIGGVVFIGSSYILQLAIPQVDPATADVAWYVELGRLAGPGVANALNLILVILGFSSCLSIQAGSSRLLYVMGRDGVLPRRLFGYISKRFESPVFNIVFVGAITMIASGLDLSQATSFVNFGAFAAFTLINVCVIRLFVRNRGTAERLTLARGVVLPIMGAAVDVYLLLQLNDLAKILGIIWLVIGVVYLAIMTRGFRIEPPKISIDDVPSNERTPMASLSDAGLGKEQAFDGER